MPSWNLSWQTAIGESGVSSNCGHYRSAWYMHCNTWHKAETDSLDFISWSSSVGFHRWLAHAIAPILTQFFQMQALICLSQIAHDIFNQDLSLRIVLTGDGSYSPSDVSILIPIAIV